MDGWHCTSNKILRLPMQWNFRVAKAKGFFRLLKQWIIGIVEAIKCWDFQSNWLSGLPKQMDCWVSGTIKCWDYQSNEMTGLHRKVFLGLLKHWIWRENRGKAEVNETKIVNHWENGKFPCCNCIFILNVHFPHFPRRLFVFS